MKITHDSELDALYIQFLETTVTTEHLAEGIAADYDAEGRLAGIEILDALKRFGGTQTLRQVILEDVGFLCIPAAPAWTLGRDDRWASGGAMRGSR